MTSRTVRTRSKLHTSVEYRPLNVLHTLSGLHVGGIGQLVRQNVAAMDPDQVKNYVCYFTPRHDLLESYRESRIEPICLDHRGKRHIPRTLWRLIRLIRRLKIDIIHANHGLDRGMAAVAGRLLGIPVVVTVHHIAPMQSVLQTYSRRRVFGISMLEKVAVKRFVVISQSAKDVQMSEYGLDESKIEVIYSGINAIKRFGMDRETARKDVRSAFGLDDAFPLLLNVGRLHPVKGQKHLVPMMRLVLEKWPKAHLLIFGEGQEREALTAAIEQAGLENHITLLGQRSDVPDLLKGADLFVFPGLNEALGISVIEAMATGLPVVATNVGGLRELISDGDTGLLVEPGDPDALAKAVLSVLDMEDKGQAMGLRAQRHAVENFDAATTASRLESLYYSVTDKSGWSPDSWSASGEASS